MENVRARVRFLNSQDVAPRDAVGEVTSHWLTRPCQLRNIVLRAEAYSYWMVESVAVLCHATCRVER